MTREYQICSRCVMDTSDPEITFDSNGVCNHCIEFEQVTSKRWFPNEEGAKRLTAMLDRIKADGKRKDYDCIIGLSGGVDSSYVALKAKEWSLRPLVVHVDAGWNSELAVSNIENIVKYCGYDLHTHVVRWEEMRALHLSYLRSGISNQDVPQDHAFISTLYRESSAHGIKYLLTGGNYSTEAIFPSSWHGSAMDGRNLRAIHARFGDYKLRTYRPLGFFGYYAWYPFVRGLKKVYPLNFIPYTKHDAVSELQEKIGWRPYGRKHGESLFTRFFQNYFLPEKFGYDKRRPHLSSLIVTKQIARNEAMRLLMEDLYDPNELERDKAYVASKLGITVEELEGYVRSPCRSHRDFANWENSVQLAKRAARLVGR